MFSKKELAIKTLNIAFSIFFIIIIACFIYRVFILPDNIETWLVADNRGVSTNVEIIFSFVLMLLSFLLFLTLFGYLTKISKLLFFICSFTWIFYSITTIQHQNSYPLFNDVKIFASSNTTENEVMANKCLSLMPKGVLVDNNDAVEDIADCMKGNESFKRINKAKKDNEHKITT